MHIIPYYPSAEMLFPNEVFVLKIQDGWIVGGNIVCVGDFSDSLTLGGECYNILYELYIMMDYKCKRVHNH